MAHRTIANGHVADADDLLECIKDNGTAYVGWRNDFGVDASKAASPVVGQCYFATDTQAAYICYVAGRWDRVGSYLYASNATAVDCKGTGPTTAFSFTLTGGHIGTSKMVEAFVRCSLSNTTGNNRTPTVVFNVGGSSVSIATGAAISTGTSGFFEIWASIMEYTDAAHQRISLVIKATDTTALTTYSNYGSSLTTENLAVNATISITIAWNTATTLCNKLEGYAKLIA